MIYVIKTSSAMAMGNAKLIINMNNNSVPVILVSTWKIVQFQIKLFINNIKIWNIAFIKN